MKVEMGSMGPGRLNEGKLGKPIKGRRLMMELLHRWKLDNHDKCWGNPGKSGEHIKPGVVTEV